MIDNVVIVVRTSGWMTALPEGELRRPDLGDPGRVGHGHHGDTLLGRHRAEDVGGTGEEAVQPGTGSYSTPMSNWSRWPNSPRSAVPAGLQICAA